MVDNTENILGANNSNNQFDSSSVASNEDGSMIERQEYLQSARLAGKLQTFEKNITAAANAGSTAVGTITAQGVVIESVILKANGVTTADLTSAAIKGGASAVIEFINAATAVTASINAEDEQLKAVGPWQLDAAKTIIMDLQGTGATAVDLDVIINYRAQADGGYIA